MSENKIKILAESIEEFKEIETKIKKLPGSTLNQIITVKRGLMGIECEIRNPYREDYHVALPSTTQISFFDDFIGAYCHEFFFRIPIIKKISFVFVEELNKEK